ncbi:MAG: DUF4391 domain-containing protein [Oscillospiraceae bacterium]|nr:DUF4391 domain-containing protein [Oscillospiraceae bacterium]
MLDLPKSSYFGRIIAKEKIYSHAGADGEIKELFVEQVERIRWLNKISPATVNIAQGEQVQEIQVIEVTLTTATPDKRILPTILKSIRYKIVFALVCKNKTTYAVYYDGKTAFTSDKPPKLIGNDTDSIWENILVQMRGSAIGEGKTLDEQIADDAARESLIRRIERLEKQAWSERQPRRKWELAEEVKALQKELENIENG